MITNQDLWIEISKIGGKIDDAKEIQEVEELNLEMKKKCEDRKNEVNEKVRKEMVKNFILVVDRLRDFYDKWGESQAFPSSEELNVAERLAKMSLKEIDKINEKDFPSFFDEKFQLETRKGIVELRVMIDEEKSLRQNY